MSKVEMCTNYNWRHFKYSYEVPQDVIDDQFDHLYEECYECEGDKVIGDVLCPACKGKGKLPPCDGFLQYKGWWYHLSDFMSFHNEIHCPNPPEWANGWDGYTSDSFFSGVVIKLSDDCEEYQIGTYMS